MNQLYRRYQFTRFIIDTPLLIIAYILAIQIFNYFYSSAFSIDIIFIIIEIIAWYCSAFISKIYIDRRSNKFSEEILFIVYTLTLLVVLSGAISFFLQIFSAYHFSFFVVFITLFFVLQIVSKYSLRRNLQFAYLRNKNCDNILLVGSTEAAKEFFVTVNIHFYYGYKCIGIIGDSDLHIPGCSYMGNINELSSVLQKERVDEVVITLPNSQLKQIGECIEVCDYYGVRTKLIPDFHQYSTSSTKLEYLGLMPILKIKDLPLDKQANKIVKRFFDFTFSLLFLTVIGTWLIPLIALLIKLTSRGPIFFKQERWGLNNKRIIMYKFRTMIPNHRMVDDNGIFIQTSRNDSRITPIGRYLRSSSLDEIPQFLNVLLGDMSIVGPRPHVTPLNIESMQLIDNYLQRHLVKPGITGWAQVNGSRGETTRPGAMENRIRFDLYYINNWTFWLDCQIIIQTIINILRGDQNAY